MSRASRLGVSSLSLLVQLLSALSPCAPASDGRTAVAIGRDDGPRSVLVSTIDGALTALSVGGETLWTVDSVKGPLFSSTFSYSKGSPQLVPGLDRFLYELDGNSLQQLPVTVDSMMEGGLALEGSVLAGSRERAVQGLDVHSGKLLYTCDMSQCVQYSDALSAVPNADALKVTLDRVQLRGASASSGAEQWNFTVGRLHLSLSRDAGAEHSEDDELGINLKVDAVGGVITALRKHSGAQLWSKQFSSPVVDLWSVGNGRLHRVVPWQDSAPRPMPSTVLLGSYNGQLYVQPVHPTHRGTPQAPGVPLLSKEPGPIIYSLRMPQTGQQEQRSQVMVDAAVSQLLLPTNSPAGVGGYFCAASTNVSQSMAGLSLPPPEGRREGATCNAGSDGDPRCPAAPGSVTRYSVVWKLLTTLTSPVMMAVVIIVLVALVVRSKRKRKILEHDILELRQQSSSVTLTPSTPLVDLEAVAEELMGTSLRYPLGRVGVVRKMPSKSESSEDSIHPCESESRFCSDFMPSELLGRGAFGVVYRCQNRVDGSNYAVKRIKLPCKEGAREKVMREAKALAQLDHPGIVRYYGAWVEKGCVEDPEWEGHFSTDTGREEQRWWSTAGGPKSSHQDNPAPHMQALIDASLASGSTHSSFSVEFRDSSKSHYQVDGTSASTSGVEFQITQDSSDAVPSAATSEGDEEGTGRDGGCAGVVLPSAQLFIQMQLCRKDSLRDWLRTSVETRSRKRVLLYFEQTLDAVCYVHHKGMMHRDLKPSNIFFSFDGGIKIGDFGLVAGDFDSLPISSRHTLLDLASLNRKGRTGNVGTRLYISPEQVAGIDYDQKVDIYSLGVIFYEMNHAFLTEMERTKVLEGLHNGHFPVAFKESLPEELELVRWMLSPDPAHRPSAKQVASSARLAALKGRVKAMLKDHLPRL